MSVRRRAVSQASPRALAHGRRAHRSASLTAVATLTALAAGPAHAGALASAHSPVGHAGAAWLVLAAVALGALAVLAVARCRPRMVALTLLTCLVAVLGVETSVHSVHHLFDPQTAAACAVLAGTQHVLSHSPEAPDVADPVWTVQPALAIAPDRLPLLHGGRPHGSRAPPSPSATRLS